MASQFHDLLVEQLPRMRAYAMALARNRAAADDLLQQTALKAWNAQGQFVAGTNFKAWLYKIMRNEHINTYRRQKAPHVSLDLVPEEFIRQAGDQETKLLAGEVFQAVDRLAKVQREVFLMNFVGGLSYDEIAETLGCSLGTVKSRLWRARNEIQKYVFGPDGPPQAPLGEGEMAADPEPESEPEPKAG